MTEHFPELYLENQICFPLYAASRLTTKLYTPFLEELDLTYPQYLVMLALWQEDGQSVKAIGESLYLESNTLTPLLKRLEQKGLVERMRSKADERTVIISLSKAGTALKQQAKHVPAKVLDCFVDQSLSKEELIDFQKTLFRLMNFLKEKDKLNRSL